MSRKRAQKSLNATAPRRWSKDPGLVIGQAIMLQAIRDWRMLCAGRTAGGESFNSIRFFMRSQLAEACMGFTDISPIYILDMLEREREDAGME